MIGCMIKMWCFKILLGRMLWNIFIFMVICLLLFNMMNWVYYMYLEEFIEKYNKYLLLIGVVFLICFVLNLLILKLILKY